MKLTITDLNLCVTRIPKDVRSLMKKHRLFIGGGFIRNTISGEKVNDIDFFGPSKEIMTIASQELALSRSARVHETKYAMTVINHPRIPVQFIYRWLYSDIKTLCDEFDYTVCQAAIGYFGEGEDAYFDSVCSESFYHDLAARRLVYTAPKRDEEAGGSFLRMRKFLQRGYSIQAPSMAGVVARLIGKFNEYACDIRDEDAATKVITGLLREVDPLVVVDGIDVIDEHENEV